MVMKAIVTLCTIVGLVTGCRAPTHERTFMTMGSTDPAITNKVRLTGQYRLYVNPPRSPTTQKATPVLEARLNKDDLLGLALNETGHLLAVIGAEGKPLADSTAAYTWTMQPDPGQTDPDRTVLLVVGIVFAIGIGIGIAAATADPWSCVLCF
jgi:hypothetical protein